MSFLLVFGLAVVLLVIGGFILHSVINPQAPPPRIAKYSLPDADRAAIANQQIEQFTRTLFEHELNVARLHDRLAAATNETDREGLNASLAEEEAAMDVIEAAIAATQTKRDALG